MMDLEEKKPSVKQRSAVACQRCRKSKVRCVNDGQGNKCQNCKTSDRECLYINSAPAIVSTPKRTELAVRVDTEGESRKRPKKQDPESARKISHRSAEDVLESPILTKKVWQDVWTAFRLHYYTELPFFHPPTFNELFREDGPSRSTDASPELKILLLGVLTLTARFSPELVTHHNPGSLEKALCASDHYAGVLRSALQPIILGYDTPISIEHVQALLMLGLYDWGLSRGSTAWRTIGNATRMAQAMGLAYLDDPEPSAPSKKVSQNGRLQESGSGRKSLSPKERESRRRTLWSCFILDRYLSGGRRRPRMFRVDELWTQLPASEGTFSYEFDEKTAFLSEVSDSLSKSDEGSSTRQILEDDALLSRFVILVDIWADFSNWSTLGGRFTEKLPPWNDGTTFFKLRKKLSEFHASLPPKLRFDIRRLKAHIEQKTASMYVAMHTLYLLCIIVLHREYVPFIPIRCERPEGPLDEPVFPKDQFPLPDDQPEFWVESAKSMFKASVDIIDLVNECRKCNVFPESAQVAFATYTAAFTGVYAVNFPQMDVDGVWRRKPSGQAQAHDPLVTSREVLNKMADRLPIAKEWMNNIKLMDDYFVRILKDIEAAENSRRKDKGDGSDKLSLRHGGPGGGYEEYRHVERGLKEFGAIDDHDSSNHQRPGSAEHGSSRASTADAQHQQGRESHPAEDSASAAPVVQKWATVNMPSASATTSEDGRTAAGLGSPLNPSNNRPAAHQQNPTPAQTPTNTSGTTSAGTTGAATTTTASGGALTPSNGASNMGPPSATSSAAAANKEWPSEEVQLELHKQRQWLQDQAQSTQLRWNADLNVSFQEGSNYAAYDYPPDEWGMEEGGPPTVQSVLHNQDFFRGTIVAGIIQQ